MRWNFGLTIPIPKSDIDIHHSTKMMLFGSCFSENIGRRLSENKFDVDINPFGILYNRFIHFLSDTTLVAKSRFLKLILFS